MKVPLVLILVLALAVMVPSFTSALAQDKPEESATPKQAAVPKYDLSTEVTLKGTVEAVKDRECAVSHGLGNHLTVKLADGKTIEVHVASTKFMKNYELSFNKGDQVEVTGSKVTFEGAETIFAREIKRGDDVLQFRDKSGKPVW